MKFALLGITLTCAVPALGAEVNPVGKADCKVDNPHPVAREKVSWTGACKDGYADGAGTLEWSVNGRVSLHFEGTLLRGRSHGDGYTRNADRTQYEGAFVDGKRHGKGIEQRVDQTRYEGDWKNGLRDGTGTQTYPSGGRYAGQWKNGEMHGHGKATYSSGKVFEGEFSEGRQAGQPAIKDSDAKSDYSLAADRAYTGTRIKHANVSGNNVPFRKSWDAMSAAEQRSVRREHGMLHEDDEPPYPANGTANLFRSISEGQSAILTTGYLRMDAMIDSTGAPSTVTVFSSPDPGMTKVATFVLMKEKFKPGLCSGTPCPMVYSVAIQFGVE